MSLAATDKTGATTTRRKTRVLFVDHTPIMGGAQISLLELVQTLDRRSFEVAVACTDRCPRLLELFRETDTEVHPVRLPRLMGNPLFMPVRYVQSVRDLLGVCARFRPDIIHSNSVRTHIYGASAGKLTGAGVIWTLRDMEFPRRLFRRTAGWADAVICISESVCEHYNLDGRFSHLRVVPNGIVLPPIDREYARRKVRDELRLADDTPVAGSVGRMLPWKGQAEFVKAAALVSRQLPDARFVILGNPDSPPYIRELKSLVEQLGIGDRVIFPGFREDILSWMCAFDVLVHSSKEPEPFGRVVVEAMAVGVPVIASPLGGPAEIIEHGENGLLVHPEQTRELADAMARILQDGRLSERLSDRGRRTFSEKYDQAVETGSVQAVYDSVMTASPAR